VRRMAGEQGNEPVRRWLDNLRRQVEGAILSLASA